MELDFIKLRIQSKLTTDATQTLLGPFSWFASSDVDFFYAFLLFLGVLVWFVTSDIVMASDSDGTKVVKNGVYIFSSIGVNMAINKVESMFLNGDIFFKNLQFILFCVTLITFSNFLTKHHLEKSQFFSKITFSLIYASADRILDIVHNHSMFLLPVILTSISLSILLNDKVFNILHEVFFAQAFFSIFRVLTLHATLLFFVPESNRRKLLCVVDCLKLFFLTFF